MRVHPVADLDLAGQRHAVGDDAVTADHVVVGDVDVGHEQVVVAHDRLAARRRAAADGHILADVVVVADLGRRDLASEFQILRQAGDGGCGVYPASFADARPVVDHGTGPDPAVVADDDVARHVSKRLYGHVPADLGIGMNVG